MAAPGRRAGRGLPITGRRGASGLKTHRLTVERKKGLAGFLFVVPWLVGFMIFFIRPLIASLRYSVLSFSPNDLTFVPLKNGWFSNYWQAFTQDTKFLPYFTASLQTLAYQVPIIVVFSVFVGTLLKTEFRGRTFMRSIFFLPIIVNTGIVYSIVRQSLLDVARGGAQESGSIFNPAVITEALYQAGLPTNVVDFVSNVISQSVDCVWLSGIQILIVLAGLMAIPASYYEVAQVEGGSAWVVFWKVTLPSVAPFILVVVVYTIVDSFTSTTNQAMKYITDVVYGNYRISYGSALFWIYFLAVFALIGLVFLIAAKRIRYEDR